MTTLLRLQTGACGGDAMALLCADSPAVEQLVAHYGVEILWQPSLSMQPVKNLDALLDDVLANTASAMILC